MTAGESGSRARARLTEAIGDQRAYAKVVRQLLSDLDMDLGAENADAADENADSDDQNKEDDSNESQGEGGDQDGQEQTHHPTFLPVKNSTVRRKPSSKSTTGS